ncbi:NAD(+) diphosphatase, partial [Chloroflexota bacterium]
MAKESIYKSHQPAVFAESENEESGYWFVFYSTKLLIQSSEGSIPYIKSLTELNLSPVRTQYLGRLKEHPCYSAEVLTDTIAPEGMSFSELRPLYGVLDEDIFLLAGKAIQVVTWDQTHQYCGRCGHKTETIKGERVKICPDCGLMGYPCLSPAVIIAVFKDDKILLSHNAGFRGNLHSIIAGFVDPGETLEECIEREIMEEVGLQVKNIKYFGSQPWPFPNSLMIGFTADYKSGEIKIDGKEISEADWYDVNSLP